MKEQSDEKRNTWVIIAMVLFTFAKVTALICATIIALKANIWIGSALFVGAIFFRITWTYLPTAKELGSAKPAEQYQDPGVCSQGHDMKG